jgi:membrane protease YdiL (CAAX protease family)
VCPVTAAVILVHREQGATGVTALLQRSFDYRRIDAKAWLIPTILLPPVATALSYGLQRVRRGPLPSPQVAVLTASVLFLAFLVSALGEELGWSGYAIDPLQARWDALQASILLGVIWAMWHIVPLIQAERAPGWIAWWCLGTVATRVLMVWLYNNTGKSVFAVAVYHAMSNLSWQLLPADYDPQIMGLILAGVAVAVTAIWGPRTLARRKDAS